MANTKSTVYSFDAFQLNPLARELKCDGALVELAASAFDCLVYLVEHRERPVGQDELIAAVWGRADVSDNLLRQTIVRLRRALGDDANGQRFIKTLARVGYRWVLDTTVSSNVPSDEPARDPSARLEASTRTTRTLSLPPWLRHSLWITPLLILVATAGYWRWRADARKPISFNHGTAIVLPAEVSAPEDWKWLRIGLMDLISGDLREARIPVESTQTVLDLLSEPDTADHSRFAAFVLVIRPHVTLLDNTWRVQLDATSPNGRTWQAASTSGNVLNATHSANDLLLAQMGEPGAAEPDKSAANDAKEEYLMRMDAASYAGSTDIERELIEKAPPDLRETPEFDYAKSVFYCIHEDYEPCKQGLAELLQRLPADKQPVLRGRVLAEQWYIYFREHKYAEGEAALSEAVQLLLKQKNTGYLAHAYAQRAELEILDGKFDQAELDFGRSRVNYALAGDTAAAFGVDGSLARLSMQRGQYAQAIPTIERAYEQYQRMGMRQFLPEPLQDLIISQRMLLQYPDELATTDRYWPLEQKHIEFAEEITRHVLVYERAFALADNGRTIEASDLLEHLLAQIKLDPQGEPGLQGYVEALLARFALERGMFRHPKRGYPKHWRGICWNGIPNCATTLTRGSPM